MALFLLTLTFMTRLTAVDSTANITSCTSLSNDQCKQNLTSCPQPPCAFSCGRTAPQYSCSQDCSPSGNLTEGNICGALECQASDYCNQICLRLDCNSLSCTSRNCRQTCTLADCRSMTCQQSVISCEQMVLIPPKGQVMKCDAKSCNQNCQRSSRGHSCDMTCSETVETCDQTVRSSKSSQLQCSAGVKNCTQRLQLFAIGHLECDASRCVQQCSLSSCSMKCLSSARECTQTQDGFGSEEVTMFCDADICRQHCSDAKCNVTCSSTVKECYQTCNSGNCLVTCDAENCYGVKGMSTTPIPTWFYPTDGVSPTQGTLLTLCLVVMLYALI